MIKRYLAAALLLVAPYTHAQELGPELVVNGNFETADNWTLGYSWQILPAPGALAFHNEGYTFPLEQATSAILPGHSYQISYTVSGSAGSTYPVHRFRIHGTGGNATCPFSVGDGTVTCTLVAPVGAYSLQLLPGYGLGAVVDNVSVREVLV